MQPFNSSNSDNWSTMAKHGSRIPTLPCLEPSRPEGPISDLTPEDKLEAESKDVHGAGMQFSNET